MCKIKNTFAYTYLGESMKKFFQIVGLLTLMVGSFIYTDKITTASKQTDELLLEIKSKKDGYKENATPPIIKDDTIIPGTSGQEVDVEKSYQNMRKIGYFDDKLLVYKKIPVSNPIDKNKDKYIIAGTNSKKEVSLIFRLDQNDDITNIIKILDKNKVKGSFFITSKYLEQHHNQIINLVEDGHTIGNLSNNEDYEDSDFVWIKTIVTNIGPQTYNYCYTAKPNKKIIKICSLNDSFTIMPTKIIKHSPLLNLKKSLTPGAIISFEVDSTLNNQIEPIINYILSKGYTIASLEDHLRE